MSRNTLAVGALLSCACVSHAGFATFDFETDDSGAVLVNGQDIMSPDEFGLLASVSSSGGNAGAAIFDSDPMGPNSGVQDQDLLVGLGNILILQSSAVPRTPRSPRPGSSTIPTTRRRAARSASTSPRPPSCSRST